ncbi:MAG: DUF2258 domain-containing protein [Caldisphaera sp.]|nr:MAG: DUF2258 domain-containing protein [Caldisphaera sp.]
MLKETDEEINRDLERAEEYEETIGRSTILGNNRFELSTGIIIAARFADKLRRVAIISLKNIVPREIIIRDISSLNKKLYDEIVNKRKMGKLDLIKILLEVYYDENNKKLVFDNIKLIHYLTEEQCVKYGDEKVKEIIDGLEKLRAENQKLKESLDKIKLIVSQ